MHVELSGITYQPSAGEGDCPMWCLPGVSDINVHFSRTLASNQAVECLSGTPKTWAGKRDARQLPNCQYVTDMVGRALGIGEHHTNLFLYFPQMFYKTINQETRFG